MCDAPESTSRQPNNGTAGSRAHSKNNNSLSKVARENHSWHQDYNCKTDKHRFHSSDLANKKFYPKSFIKHPKIFYTTLSRAQNKTCSAQRERIEEEKSKEGALVVGKAKVSAKQLASLQPVCLVLPISTSLSPPSHSLLRSSFSTSTSTSTKIRGTQMYLKGVLKLYRFVKNN